MRVSRQRCFSFRRSRRRQLRQRPRRASSTSADICWVTRLVGIGGASRLLPSHTAASVEAPTRSGSLPRTKERHERCARPLSLPKSRFVRIDGVVRRGSDTQQCLRTSRSDVCRACPSQARREFAPHYNSSHISQEFAEGARRLLPAMHLGRGRTHKLMCLDFGR